MEGELALNVDNPPVKKFPNFGLEWEIQFSMTIINDFSSEDMPIMSITGKLHTGHFNLLCLFELAQFFGFIRGMLTSYIIDNDMYNILFQLKMRTSNILL